MRPIPKKLKEEMAADPFYKRCCVTGSVGSKIDWHHNLIFSGRQVNEKWAILPLSKHIHDNVWKYRDILDWIMLNRATDDQLKKYSKAVDLVKRKKQLNEKYGKKNISEVYCSYS